MSGRRSLGIRINRSAMQGPLDTVIKNLQNLKKHTKSKGYKDVAIRMGYFPVADFFVYGKKNASVKRKKSTR